MQKVDLLLELLKNKKEVSRMEINKLVWSSSASSLIETLTKKGHVIWITYWTYGHPTRYKYIKYVKPFYIVMRDIERNYPDLLIGFVQNTRGFLS